MAEGRDKRCVAPEPAGNSGDVSWVMSHYQWEGDTLLEDVSLEIRDERDRVISELVCNHFAINLNDLREWADQKKSDKQQMFDGVLLGTPDGREFYVRDIPAFEAVRAEIYDKEVVIKDATVTIWENTKTGAVSFGWSGGEVVEDESGTCM